MMRQFLPKQIPASQPSQATGLEHSKATFSQKPPSASGIFGHSFTDVSVLSPKLTVGPPDDAFEQEADRIADQIDRLPQVGSTVRVTDSSQRIQRLCKSCSEAEEEDSGGAPVAELGEEDIGGAAPLAGGGNSLGSGVRAFMEPRFGFDFGKVKIHTDQRSASLARDLGARAFTVGRDIFFGRDEYEPGSSAGRHLLAHELTHVVQQNQVNADGPVLRKSELRIQRYLVGPPQQITATPIPGGAATWGHCRNFNEVVNWGAPTLRNGFILQECMNADTITQCDGTGVPAPNTPYYWEAWQVDASGSISDGNTDTWFRAGRPGTTGSWTFDSNVFAVGGPLDPAWGFARGAVGTAGGLLSTTTGPSHDDLIQPSLVRHRGGRWDCCNGKDTHTPI